MQTVALPLGYGDLIVDPFLNAIDGPADRESILSPIWRDHVDACFRGLPDLFMPWFCDSVNEPHTETDCPHDPKNKPYNGPTANCECAQLPVVFGLMGRILV